MRGVRARIVTNVAAGEEKSRSPDFIEHNDVYVAKSLRAGERGVRARKRTSVSVSVQKQIHVIFSGHVHGVGFRYTTESIANELGLSGWVKNIRAGDVEVLAEGEEAALKDIVSRLEEQFSGYIVKKQVSWGPATGEFKDFGIEF